MPAWCDSQDWGSQSPWLHWKATIDPHLHWRLLNSHRQVQLSLLWGHYFFLLNPGVPSEHLWQVWVLILNAPPTLLSCGFSFALGNALFWLDPTFYGQWLFSSLQFWCSCRRRWAHVLLLHHHGRMRWPICYWRRTEKYLQKEWRGEPKQKQHPVLDVSNDESKVWCCKEQFCIGN